MKSPDCDVTVGVSGGEIHFAFCVFVVDSVVVNLDKSSTNVNAAGLLLPLVVRCVVSLEALDEDLIVEVVLVDLKVVDSIVVVVVVADVAVAVVVLEVGAVAVVGVVAG